jgi:PEP-CTERM motif
MAAVGRVDQGVEMRNILLAATALGAMALTGGPAAAGTYSFDFGKPGVVSGSATLTYGSTTDSIYNGSTLPAAYQVTGITGFVTSPAAGLVNAPITGLYAINHATPDHTPQPPAPNDFSRIDTLTLSAGQYAPTYDNLFWPGGSQPVTLNYTNHGGFLDIFGLMWTMAGGYIANFWSNGTTQSGGIDYGISVINLNTNTFAQYVSGGVTVPEPTAMALLGAGLVGLGAVRRRRAVDRADAKL